MPSTDQPRVSPLAPDERDERQAALVARAGAEFAVYTTLVRSTDVFADLLPFGQRLLEKSTLVPRLRELVILRVAWRCRAAYIWSHHEAIGRTAGLTEDDLAALATDRVDSADSADSADTVGAVDTVRAVLLRSADELVADHRLGDPTWRDLAGRYPTEQVIEICLLAGLYVMLAGVLNSLGVQLEDGYPPPDWAA